MAREYSTYVTEHLEPTADNATIVNARRVRVREFCHGMLRDPLFAAYISADTRRSKPGVLCAIPLMIAKAAMAERGRNLIDHWHYFQVWFGVSWRVWYWEAHTPQWMAIGTLMSSTLYNIDFDGDLLSGGQWTPVRAEGVNRFGTISDEEALYWIGEIGGPLHYVDHPHGTLIHFPQTLTVPAGELLTVTPKAVFGKPPYSISLGTPRPTWATLSIAATNRVSLRPPAATVPKEYKVPVIVTDATGEAVEAIYKVTVT